MSEIRDKHTHTHTPHCLQHAFSSPQPWNNTLLTRVSVWLTVFLPANACPFPKPFLVLCCLSIGGQPCSAVSHPLCDIGQSYNFFFSPPVSRREKAREIESEWGRFRYKWSVLPLRKAQWIIKLQKTHWWQLPVFFLFLLKPTWAHILHNANRNIYKVVYQP